MLAAEGEKGRTRCTQQQSKPRARPSQHHGRAERHGRKTSPFAITGELRRQRSTSSSPRNNARVCCDLPRPATQQCGVARDERKPSKWWVPCHAPARELSGRQFEVTSKVIDNQVASLLATASIDRACSSLNLNSTEIPAITIACCRFD